MFFPNSFLDSIKDRVPISSVISKKVKITNKNNKLIGLCPFHNEKTPSFSANDAKGFYYCFGCQASGDIFKFVMEIYRYNFVESVQYLADLAGIEMPQDQQQNFKETDATAKIYEALSYTAEWFATQLNHTTGYEALKYLEMRNINIDTIKNFNIGFAPNNKNSLIEYLKAKNIDNTTIEKAGLVIQKDGKLIDKFRNRVMFPIFDSRNRVIAFGGRSFGDIKPKYLNSPETAVFKKSEVLYAKNIAKNFAYKNNRVIVVEGYIDTIALHRSGIKDTVATLGTAITQSHLAKLWKLADEPIICLDGDKAGVRAMQRTAEIAFPNLVEGKSLSFVSLPKSMDPDDIINNYGAKHLEDLLKNSIPLSEVIWDIELQKIKKETPEQISLLEKRLNTLTASLKIKTLQKNYQNFFAKKLWNLNRNIRVLIGKNNDNKKFIPKFGEKLDLISRYEHILIAQTLNDPELLKSDRINEELLSIDFNYDFLNNIRSIILDYIVNIDKDTEITNEDLKKLLVSKNLSKEYNFLCGNHSPFIDKISKMDVSLSAKKWELLFKRYRLSLIEKDYHDSLKTICSEEKLQGLNNEITIIRDSIIKLESIINE